MGSERWAFLTPVIMVTALCDAKDVDKASSFGVSDYVTKPVDFAKLTEKISKILNKKKYFFYYKHNV